MGKQTDAYKSNGSIPAAGSIYNYTKEELQEYLKCSKDAVYFIKTYMKIIDVDKGLVPFLLHDYQEKMVRSYSENRFNITLASRQIGKSSTVVAFFLHYILFNVNVNACMSANKQKIAVDLLGRLKLAYENLPRFLQQGVVKWAATEVELENGSRIFAAATSSSSVRGGSYNCVSGDSEVIVKLNNHIQKIKLKELAIFLEKQSHPKEIKKINSNMDELTILENKYTNWYNSLMNKCQLRNWTKKTRPKLSTEQHHIIPRSCGGDNGADNKVYLTYREHFVAHKLLIRMYTGKYKAKMICALFRMANGHKYQQNFMSKSSNEYQMLRTEFCKVRSEIRTGAKHTEETKNKISLTHKGVPKSDETRRKLSESHMGIGLGKKRTLESIEKFKQTIAINGRSEKQIEANKLINKNPEKIQKMANTHRGMKRSEESKKRMSEARKKYFENGGSTWNKGKIVSDEIRQTCKDGWAKRKAKLELEKQVNENNLQ